MRIAVWLAGILSALAVATTVLAEPLEIAARQIARFGGLQIGERIDGLIWRGGLHLTSRHADFGGISGFAFLDHGERFVAVTDVGSFLSGRLTYDAGGAPEGVIEAEVTPIRNSSGDVLPRAFARDAETVETVFREEVPVAVRVGFENLTRVADFALVDGRPGGPAREVDIPRWLSDVRTNEAIESVCIAPPASPIAGSTLIITEGHVREPGSFAATLLGVRDRGDLHLAQSGGGFNPTDCAFLPNGDLLVLERALRWFAFYVQVRRIPADRVVAGAIMDGEVLLSTGDSEVDNYEGLGVHIAPDGEVRVTLVSDDNFHALQRTLLLQFGLPR